MVRWEEVKKPLTSKGLGLRSIVELNRPHQGNGYGVNEEYTRPCGVGMWREISIGRQFSRVYSVKGWERE